MHDAQYNINTETFNSFCLWDIKFTTKKYTSILKNTTFGTDARVITVGDHTHTASRCAFWHGH